jgi:hypothetical protein
MFVHARQKNMDGAFKVLTPAPAHLSRANNPG